MRNVDNDALCRAGFSVGVVSIVSHKEDDESSAEESLPSVVAPPFTFDLVDPNCSDTIMSSFQHHAQGRAVALFHNPYSHANCGGVLQHFLSWTSLITHVDCLVSQEMVFSCSSLSIIVNDCEFESLGLSTASQTALPCLQIDGFFALVVSLRGTLTLF